MSVYFMLKSAHLLFVMAWVAAVFYLPRLMINYAESPNQPDVQARLLLMAKRLYKFGHVMFALALLFGVGLIHFAGFGPWLHAKLLLVAVLFAYYIWSYKRLQKAQAGKALPSPFALRVMNELPVFLLFFTIYLVIAKPF
ncbi:MAG: CopD family protein [Arenimonas sp.]|jgi:protoporphyrinogen IX oxidase|nr:CopD family protein [Arenimonas sp.]MBP7981821.1 CopD family protein [Arenimonas sp.]